MEKFSLIRERSGDIKYGCLMLYLDIEIDEWVEYLKGKIDEDDIYDDEDGGFGIEDEPHITVLYGFHDEITYKDLKNDMEDKVIKIDDLNFVDISFFENDDYDVLKVDVESEKLNEYNNFFRENYPYTNEYEDYHAHITLSYINKGNGDKYTSEEIKNEIFNKLKEIKGVYYIFSDAERNKTRFNIICE